MALERRSPDLMTPAQAARALHVAPRTVARWAAAGRILAVRTPGGHRRYRRVDVQTLSRETRRPGAR